MRGIGISGKQRSGKDSLCRALATHSTDLAVYHRLAFADALKREAAVMAGLPENYFLDEDNKIRHRQYLIDLGRAGRSFEPLFWVNKTLGDARTLPHHYIPVVTDVRYPNEAKALREAGFLLVRVNASPETIVARGGQLLADESETGLDNWTDWDVVVSSDHDAPTELAKLVLSSGGVVA